MRFNLRRRPAFLLVIFAFYGILIATVSIFGEFRWGTIPLVAVVALVLSLVSIVIYILLELRGRFLNFPELVGRDLESDIIIKETESVLTLLDGSGSLAHYKKVKVIKAIDDRVFEYVEKGIWAEGGLDTNTVSIEGCSGFEVIPVPEKRNSYELKILFQNGLGKGEERELVMEWDIPNSFKGEIEYFSTNFTKPIREHRIRVIFPKARPVKSAWVDFSFEGKRITYVKRAPEISEDRLELSYSVYYALPGIRTVLFWEW